MGNQATAEIDPAVLEEAFDRTLLAGPYICVGTVDDRRVDELLRRLELQESR